MIILQIIFSILMYFGTFISYFLPIKIFSRTVNNRLENDLNNQLKLSNSDFYRESRQQKIYSYCNCLATGIFIAIPFMNIQMVKDEFECFLQQINIKTTYPLAELTILIGFFMVLFFEQLVIKFRSNNSAPFLHLDEEANDEEQCKESLLSEEGILIDQNVQDNQGLENRSESLSDLSNDIANDVLNTFKNKNKKNKKKLNSFSNHHHSHDFHHHHHHFDLNSFNSEFNLSFFMLIFASSIHSVFEGLALGLVKDSGKAINFFIGIFVHECIVAVALGINAAKLSSYKGVIFGLLFSFTIPLGIFLGIIIGYTPGVFGQLVSAVFQALAIGTFIQVGFCELMVGEMDHSLHLPFKKINLMFIGFLSISLIMLISN